MDNIEYKQDVRKDAEGQSRLNEGLGDAETLIANLYRARQKSREEKRIWRKTSAEYPCLYNDKSEVDSGPCYAEYVNLEKSEWCDNCKRKSLQREIYHAASRAAGAALNAVLRAGKKLASPNVKLSGN